MRTVTIHLSMYRYRSFGSFAVQFGCPFLAFQNSPYQCIEVTSRYFVVDWECFGYSIDQNFETFHGVSYCSDQKPGSGNDEVDAREGGEQQRRAEAGGVAWRGRGACPSHGEPLRSLLIQSVNCGP